MVVLKGHRTARRKAQELGLPIRGPQALRVQFPAYQSVRRQYNRARLGKRRSVKDPWALPPELRLTGAACDAEDGEKLVSFHLKFSHKLSLVESFGIVTLTDLSYSLTLDGFV